MKKNILSEVNRVREIMGLDLLSEQKNLQIGTTVVSGDWKKKEPIQIIIDKVAKYAVLDDAAESVAGPFIDEVIDKLKEKFDGSLKKAIEAGMNLTKAKIRSGASNYYSDGSTVANVENDRFTPSAEDQDVKWDENSKPYKANLALAKRRGTNFLIHIKEALKKKGINNLDSLESEDVESVIVNTGGVTDEKCLDDPNCKKAYPNPGQFITMDLIFDKEGEEGDPITECLVDMEIYVGYYREANEYSAGKKSSENHECDSAIFDILLNNIRVFTANLNNQRDRDLGDSKDTRKVNPDRMGGTVVCGIDIDNTLAQQIMAQTNHETIEIGIQGLVTGGCPPGGCSGNFEDRHKPGAPEKYARYNGEAIYWHLKNDGYSEKMMWDQKQLNLHSEVPMVTLRWGDGEEWVGEPDVKLVRGDNSYRKIMTFDVCKREVDGEKINATTDATTDATIKDSQD